MADDDIGARGFCSYELVIDRLVRAMRWNRNEAHNELCWAVKTRELRLERNPDEILDIPVDYVINSAPCIAVLPTDIFAGSGLYPEDTHYNPPPSPVPWFELEEYSINDLERLIARLTGSATANQEQKPSESVQPSALKAAPGKRPPPVWAYALGQVAADLVAHGCPQQSEIEKLLAKVLSDRDAKAPESTVREYARELYRGFHDRMQGTGQFEANRPQPAQPSDKKKKLG